MTTIACDRETMAGDTLLSSGDIECHAQKVFKHKGACVGIAGTYVDCMVFIEWWKKGADPETAPKMKCVSALVLTADARILNFDGHAKFFALDDEFTAIGSGAQAALGAMHMGAGPRQAVGIAGKIDPATGSKTTIRKRGTNK